MHEVLLGLNEAQKEAVLATEGPVLILAGAGSGKTKALTHRVAYLIKEMGVNPENILAVTFTNKAAKEMTSRVSALISSSEFRVSNELKNSDLTRNSKFEIRNFSAMPMMGTFHSICARILREDGHYLGYKRNFTIYDEADSQSAIKQAMKDVESPDQKISVQTIKSFISSAKNELIDSNKYADLASGYMQDLVAKVYPKYQEVLKRNNALDFDDLLMQTVVLFQKFPEVLSRYQSRWQYIHIDEYQDTNHAQYMFAKLLATSSKNLCVVGDDWQSIYSWRGANFRNILDFERDYPKAKIIKLEQNYRSTKAILDAAHHVIAKNEQRSEKKLFTNNVTGKPIIVMDVRDEHEEAQLVIRESERLVREDKYKLNDIVILYRTNAQSRAIESEFVKFRVPYRIIGGFRFFERKEIKDIIAYLRVINSNDDWVAFERIINVPVRGIGDTSLAKILLFGRQTNLGISAVLEHVHELGLGAKQTVALIDFARLLEIFRRSKDIETLPELIDLVIKKSGYEKYLDDGTPVGDERIENVRELLSVGQEYLKNHVEVSLDEFLEEIALITDIDNWNPEEDAVTLMTFHAAKGLEFKAVFMVGMEENLFPHANSAWDNEQLEEERRLCYVGITRARERLYMTIARSRMLYGRTMSNSPSRFLADIPAHLIAGYENVLTSNEPNNIESVAEESLGGYLNVGDRVSHDDFGKGKVTAIDDDEVTVDFDEYGIKWLSLSYAKLKKI
jgi:DNA helicase-2/ATP-dependent DNA helicase PcrA